MVEVSKKSLMPRFPAPVRRFFYTDFHRLQGNGHGLLNNLRLIMFVRNEAVREFVVYGVTGGAAQSPDAYPSYLAVAAPNPPPGSVGVQRSFAAGAWKSFRTSYIKSSFFWLQASSYFDTIIMWLLFFAEEAVV
jgi:hypothetical protein